MSMLPPPVDLDSLRCFLAVAQLLHFRTAAARVGRSPAAVSERIKRLEDDLGVVLFERTTRRVRLTDAGARLRAHAQALLDAAAASGAVARGDGRPLPHALTIGTRFELGLSWLVPALGPLAAAAPARTLHLFMGDSEDLLDRLERGAVDACVLSAGPRRPELRQVALHPEDYVLVSRAPVALRPAALAGETLLDVTPDLPLFGYLRGEAREWRFGRHLYLGGIGAIRAVLLAQGGVAVLPRYFVQADLDAGRLVALLPPEALGSDHFRLLWRADHPRDAALQQLAVELAALPLR